MVIRPLRPATRIVLAALTALIVLPLYFVWFAWVLGTCRSAVMEFILPRIGWARLIQ